ncbi:MAG: WD40/YVTN/BNR-like repeat-containing protein, partial [Thermoanaerobaculia bacterium]
PSRPEIVYAGLGLGGGVYRSSNRGITWTYAGRGLEPGQQVIALGVDAGSARTAYAIVHDRLFKTVDSGVSWRPVDLGTAERVVRLAVDPQRPGRLYVVVERTIFRSTDGGRTWRELPTAWAHYLSVLRIDPVNPDVLYVGTYEDGLFKSTDGGAHWSLINQGLGLWQGVSGLTVDPVSRALYLTPWIEVDPGKTLLKSTDGGVNWTSITPRFPHKVVTTVAVIVGDQRSTLVAMLDVPQTLVRSEDGGRSWSRAETSPPSLVYQFLPTPYGLLAATGGGVYRSGDRAVSWRPSNNGLPGSVILGLAVDPQHGWVYAGSPDDGLFRAALDGETNWVRLRRGLKRAGFTGPIVVDPGTGAVYAGFVDLIGRSLSFGRTWELHHSAMRCVFPRSIAIDAVRPDVLYASAPSSPNVCSFNEPDPCGFNRSEDGGRTWQCHVNGLPTKGVGVLVADPVQASVLYAENLGNLYRSENGGDSWSLLSENLQPTALAIDPENPQRLWAGVPGGLARSEDGGRTWISSPKGSRTSSAWSPWWSIPTPRPRSTPPRTWTACTGARTRESRGRGWARGWRSSPSPHSRSIRGTVPPSMWGRVGLGCCGSGRWGADELYC